MNPYRRRRTVLIGIQCMAHGIRTSQYRVDERPPGAPVAVDERVDRLELGMGDGGTDHGIS